MAYKHGIYTSEIPTKIVPPVETDAGLPVIFGTAPVHLASDRAPANRPTLCYSYDEAVAAFGYSKDWKKYTLCEAIYSQFALYNRCPVVLVNVLDPAKHKEDKTNQTIAFSNGKAVVKEPVLLETLKVKITEAAEPAKEGTDYEAAYNDDEELIITALEGGQFADKTSAVADYSVVDASAVTADDIIGGIDTETGAKKGLETLNQVFPLTRMVPGMVLAPGWSHDSSVEAVMKAKAGNINEHFKAIVLVDIPTDEVKKYTDAPAWKNNNNFTGVDEVACWPMVKLGDDIFHMSTHLMGVMNVTDSQDEDGVPYVSPSNKSMQMDGLCLEDGTEVVMEPEAANYLNGQGIVTSLNFIGGWKSWGNNTACYPADTDAKDRFICARRMLNWHAATFIQTYWGKVDSPTNKRFIQTIVDSENIRLNGLTAREVLLGGRVEFREDENPTTSLLDGKVTFHTYLMMPLPARDIENVIELDPDYFKALFA